MMNGGYGIKPGGGGVRSPGIGCPPQVSVSI